MRVEQAILRAAAPIVPDDLRRDWQREWEAELAVSRARGAGQLPLALRAGGAWLHAGWLRYDRWRFEMLWHDVKYAVRTLTKRPGFALVAIASLAVGIGANAAIFGAVRAIVLRPLPFPDPDALVTLVSTTTARPDVLGGAVSPPNFTDWRRDGQGFVEMAALNLGSSALTGDGAAEQVPSASVTGGFFAVLGVAPLYGRPINLDDDPMGSLDVVVLGHGLWQRRFGARPDIVGRTVAVDGVATVVVGVMPPGFSYPLGSEMWLPLRFSEADLQTQRGAQYLDVIARLSPGTTVDAAERDMRTYAARLAELHPRYNKDTTVNVSPLRETIVGDLRPALFLMLAAVGFVLLIVCVNVANLVLTRALGRQRELAVRTAIGASRGRLVRGLLVESVLLAAVGGGAGLLLSVWAAGVMAGMDRGIGIPLLDQTRIDTAVAAFTVAVSALAAVLSGTLPAWHASRVLDVARGIREESGTTAGDRHKQRLRGGLIVAETALAVALLVGAGLLVRSFVGLVSVDLGLDSTRVQTFSLSLPQVSYPTPAARTTAIATVLERIAPHPEVEAAAAVFGLPLTGFNYSITTSTVDGRKLDQDEQTARPMQVRAVTPEYFRIMGIPITSGRSFTAADALGAPPVIVINQAAAARLWPDRDPLGHDMTLGTRLGQGGPPAGGTVVGVAGNVRDAGPARPARPTIYLAHAQFPVDSVSIVVKTRHSPDLVIDPLRRMVADLDADLPVFRVRTMEQLAVDAVARPRLFLTLLALFAGAAVLLAGIGIYGVMSHGVSQRTREIGLRLALGARRREVVGMVVGQAMALAVAGLVLGLVLGVGTARLMQSLLFGIQPVDIPTYAAVAVGFAAVALVASAIPAIRAARVDPIAALRN